MKLRSAVNAKCRECTYDPKDAGSAAQQIACRTTKSCPLHQVRPVTAKSIPVTLLKAYSVSFDQLESRARALVTPKPGSSEDRQFDHLLATESSFGAGSRQDD